MHSYLSNNSSRVRVYLPNLVLFCLEYRNAGELFLTAAALAEKNDKWRARCINSKRTVAIQCCNKLESSLFSYKNLLIRVFEILNNDGISHHKNSSILSDNLELIMDN